MTQLLRSAAVLAVLSAFPIGLTATGPDKQGTPALPKERGIYFAQSDDSALTPLMQARIDEMKPAGRMKAFATQGFSGMQMKAVVKGNRADNRVKEQPVFYLAGFDPAEILLYKVEVKGNKQREFVTSSFSAFGNIKTPKGSIEFKAEKVEGGYKLIFPTALMAGEYIFSYSPVAMPMASTTIYDFGVDAATTSRE